MYILDLCLSNCPIHSVRRDWRAAARPVPKVGSENPRENETETTPRTLVRIEVGAVRLRWVHSMKCCLCCVIKCFNSYASYLVETKFHSFSPRRCFVGQRQRWSRAVRREKFGLPIMSATVSARLTYSTLPLCALRLFSYQ